MAGVIGFLRGHAQLTVLTVLIVALWQTPAVLPVKILIVFLHEASHVIATLLTGGSVESLSIDPAQGGQVISRGGNRFLSLSAGYVGSLLIGAGLFLAAVNTHADRVVAGLLGALLLGLTAVYVRDGFGLIFGLLGGGLVLAAARFLPRNINDLILRVIGLSSMIYVPLDIFSDTIARAHLRSDARMLAEEFAGPTLFWGGLWLILSLTVIGLSLRYGLRRDSNIALRLGRGD